MSSLFATLAIALYVAHHVGDYWVQRDVDAQHKGDPGRAGRLHCLTHVLSYLATQVAFLFVVTVALGVQIATWAFLAGLVLSGAAHYFADRREPLKRLARLIPGKANFLELGLPRPGVRIEAWNKSVGDNPSLGTGLWALDQSWHIVTSVFLPALIMAMAS